MINTYGPDVILAQEHLSLHHRLYLLSLLQPVVTVLQERFIRSCESVYSPEKAFDHTLLLTGDTLLAENRRAWQKLNQMAK